MATEKRKKLPTKLRHKGQNRKMVTEERIRRFVNNYKVTLSATEAAKAAGYKGDFKNQGYELLQNGRVKELIADAALEAQAVTDVKARDILQALMEIAYFDPGELFSPQMTLQHFKDLPLRVRRCIAGYDVVKRNLVKGDNETDTVIKVKFVSKIHALDLLARHKGLVNQVSDETVTARQLEQMSDEEFIRVHRANLDKWEAHLEAQKQLRGKLQALPDATEDDE